RRARLAAEALDEDVVEREPGPHDLEGDLAVEASVQRHVDGGHAAVREVGEDAVPAVDHPADERVRHAGRHAGSLRGPGRYPVEAGRVVVREVTTARSGRGPPRRTAWCP